ncbi:MAG: type I restriction enzyme S subunit [Psychromonas sp.]|jgi:type I restriction enzyme S subunit|uniref:restriction endonuclease subunit S n=1 Tax=Psychromonas sp. TaxID=1884585 RepID=UPI0039E53AB6
MVPSGWELSNVSEISDTAMGYAFKSCDFVTDGMPLIRMGNLYQNQLQLDRNPVYLPNSFAKEYSRFVLRSGDLVMSMTGTMGKRDYGFTVKIPKGTPDSLLNQRVMKFAAKENTLISFLLYLLKSEYVLNRLYAFPGGTKQANLSAKQVGEIPFFLPPLPEQRKIAEILSTWDKAISSTERRIYNSQQQKKALMQQLLTGKKRFSEFQSGWLFGSFTDLFKIENDKKTQIKSSEYCETGKTPVIDQGKSKIAGYSDHTFIYTNIPAIIFGDHTRIIKWIDFAFVIGADGTQVLKTTNKLFQKFGYFLLTNTNIPNLGYSRHMRELKKNDFKYPSDIKEQQKIASVLTASDKEIELLEQQLSDLKQEKKALMQQLLTGKRRVKIKEVEAA